MWPWTNSLTGNSTSDIPKYSFSISCARSLTFLNIFDASLWTKKLINTNYADQDSLLFFCTSSLFIGCFFNSQARAKRTKSLANISISYGIHDVILITNYVSLHSLFGSQNQTHLGLYCFGTFRDCHTCTFSWQMTSHSNDSSSLFQSMEIANGKRYFLVEELSLAFKLVRTVLLCVYSNAVRIAPAPISILSSLMPPQFEVESNTFSQELLDLEWIDFEDKDSPVFFDLGRNMGQFTFPSLNLD